MLSKRQQTWAKKAKERLATVGAQIASEWQGEASPLTIICPSNHRFETTWKRVVSCLNRSGLVGCPTCAGEAKGQFHRKDDAVYQSLAEHGFTLIGPYQNVYTPIALRCSRGHTHTRAYRNWKKADIKCQDCFAKDIHDHFEREGWTVLSPFRRMKEKISVRCPEGHESSVLYEVWNRPRKPGYNGCNQCKPAKHGRDRALSLSQVSQTLWSRGFRLTGDYINTSTPVDVVCSNGHATSVLIGVLRYEQNRGCTECSKLQRSPSKEESESNLAAQRISTRIYQELAKQNVYQKGWKSRSWATQKAKEIKDFLGPRPDGCHLDHIVPCSFFDFRDESQVKLCWAIENLRWMEASANISRGNRLTLEEVEMFMPQQLALLQAAKFTPEYLIKAALVRSEFRKLPQGNEP